MSATFYELLKYAKTGIASPEMTHYDKLKALAMCKGGFPVSTLTGIPPISFKSDGTPLTAWSISGAMTQTGTPTPSAPIQPEQTGDKTAQLIPEIVQGGVSSDTGALSTSSTRVRTNILSITGGETYTVHAGNIYVSTIVFYADGVRVSNQSDSQDKKQKSFTVPSNANQIAIGFKKPDGAGDVTPDEAGNIMLNLGSTALDYEPYGYAIQISCGGTTQTVYLSEPLRKIRDYADKIEASGTTATVTRRIKKLVLDATENLWYNGVNRDYDIIQMILRQSLTGTTTPTNVLCTHMETAMSASVTSTTQSMAMRSNGTDIIFGLAFATINASDADSDSVITTKSISYIASQYAAGTPVCVWYVLATAQTETVTVPTLTPQKGSNTLSVGTTLQPSEVSITGKIKAS